MYHRVILREMILPRGTADATYAGTVSRSSLFPRHVAVRNIALRGVGVT